MAVEWVLPCYDAASLASRTNPLWVSSVTKRMSKAENTFSNNDAQLPALLMSVFEGHDLCHRKEWLTDGMELLKVLIFRKFVGAADTNGKNMMVGESGRVFSVDETMATPAQLEKSKGKGLVTAQSIHSTLLDRATEALCDRPREVADFIDQLQKLTIPAAVSGIGRLAAVQAGAPFDKDTMALLRMTTGASGSRRPLEALAKRLKLRSEEAWRRIYIVVSSIFLYYVVYITANDKINNITIVSIH
jgi:hypothetical protein